MLRLGWRAVADAVGHSVLVFVFLPTLVGLAGWLLYEARNPFNFSDPVVTLFLAGRGLRAALNAFDAGLHAGALAGFLNGLFVSACVASRGGDVTARQRWVVGAGIGAAASIVMAVVLIGIQIR